jgi:hypothetical protein
MTLYRKLVLMAVLAFLLPVLAFAAPASSAPRGMGENQKIVALIAAVESESGATFIRNGREHTAAEAASHLRLKWKNAGKRVRTAEDFIRYCATGSSLSGKPYRIRFANGTEIESADYFHARLRRIESTLRPKP